MSLFKVEVVPVKLEPHPNADALSIVWVYNYTVCVRTQDWIGRTKGAYLPPESVVPNDERFAFLEGRSRIKVKKLRGVVSMGLLMPVSDDINIGDDMAKAWGITHYEPALPNATMDDDMESPPNIIAPTYDVENLLRYGHLFKEGEYVYVTEKLHGANARYVFHDGRMWCGSRNRWKKPSESNLWWTTLKQNPWIETYCRKFPDNILYGELCGKVQSLTYGAKQGHYFFRVFDIYQKTGWMPTQQLPYLQDIQLVPLLLITGFNINDMRALAEGESKIPNANHIREGIVIRPIAERWTEEIGRLQLKLISNAYLEM